jgi:hypothetical protein
MPFGLRNARAMYQRCMEHVFGEHIGPTVEAYVDDIVVKSKRVNNLVDDLDIAFKCSRTYTRGLAVITRHLEPSSEMRSDKVSIGQPQSPTLLS